MLAITLGTQSCLLQALLAIPERSFSSQRGFWLRCPGSGRSPPQRRSAGSWATMTCPDTPLPTEWHVENTLKKAKPYASKKREARRRALAAAVALVHLRHRPDEAGDAWQAAALCSELLVRHVGKRSVYFVLAAARFACRAIPVRHCFDPTSSTRKEVYCLDTRAEWPWITVTDVSEWQCIPFEWRTPSLEKLPDNVPQPDALAAWNPDAQPAGEAVPLMVAAFCRCKPALGARDRKLFCRKFGCAESGAEVEIALVRRLLLQNSHGILHRKMSQVTQGNARAQGAAQGCSQGPG